MIQLILQTPEQVAVYSSSILRLTLEKDQKTPYSRLTAVVQVTANSLTALARCYRAEVQLDNVTVHNGSIETLRVVREKGGNTLSVTSRGYTAMLLQNQLAPGIYNNISLDNLMQNYCTLPSSITWESNTDTSNYIYVKENTGLWDGIANLSYKLTGKYPFITRANHVQMHPLTNPNIWVAEGEELLGLEMETRQQNLYRDYYMADASGDYSAYHYTEAEAVSREIYRSRRLALDRQYLYNPALANEFRATYAREGLLRYGATFLGGKTAQIGDTLQIPQVGTGTVTYYKLIGDKDGIRTKLGMEI